MKLKDLFEYPFFNGVLYSPLLKKTFNLQYKEDQYFFLHQGVKYLMNPNQDIKWSGGTVLITLQAKPIFRNKRTAIQLPSSLAFSFTDNLGRNILKADLINFSAYMRTYG